MVAGSVYPLNCILKKLGGIGQVQLVFDMSPVRLYGLYAKMQTLGYLPGSVPPADKAKHLKLPVAEAIDL